MAKAQKRSAREIRKPKAAVPKPVAGLGDKTANTVPALLQKSKGKL